MSVAMMVMVGMVNITMYIIVFGLYPCNDKFTKSSILLMVCFVVLPSVCPSVPECDEYIRLFEYSNILVTNIYSDIRSYQFFFFEYIRTFVRVKFV